MHVYPSVCHVGPYDASMPKVRLFCHLTPQRVLFDFSILFPLLSCFGCCMLRCQVSLSLVRSFPCGFELVTQLSSGALSLYGRCLFREGSIFHLDI